MITPPLTHSINSHRLDDNPETRDVVRRHYKIPVVVSDLAWNLIQSATEQATLEDILNDVLWMSHQYIVKRIGNKTVEFQVVIPNATAEDPDLTFEGIRIYRFILTIQRTHDHAEARIMRWYEWDIPDTT